MNLIQNAQVNTTPPAFSPELEAIRGLAALSVMLIHCIVCYKPMLPDDCILKHMYDIFLNAVNGRNAVVLFFVLSGYVLANSLSKDADTLSVYIKYIIRRLFRILPLLLLVLFFGIILLLCLNIPVDSNADFAIYGEKWFTDGYFRPDIGDIKNHLKLADFRIDQVLWTLRIELICSFLLIPLFRINRYSVLIPAPLTCLLILISYHVDKNENGAVPHVLHFLFCFQLGINIFQLIRAYKCSDYAETPQRSHNYLMWGCVLLGVYLLLYSHSKVWDIVKNFNVYFGNVFFIDDENFQIITEGMGASFLIFGSVLLESRIFKKILLNRPFQMMGRLSYSVYCIHILILKIVFVFTIFYLLAFVQAYPEFGTLTDLLIVVPASLFISTLTYKWIELPMIRKGKTLSRLVPSTIGSSKKLKINGIG